MELVQFIYCSACAKADFSPEDLNTLLGECRENNAKVNITGMLLYHSRTFFQILEGDPVVVQNLFEKIAKDRRHDRITKIVVEQIGQRAFANWTMGYSRVSAADLASIPGLNDFFTRGESYLDLGESRAKALLGAFTEGQWRLSLS